MNILVIGSAANLLECRQKFGEQHSYDFAEQHAHVAAKLERAEVVFDFLPQPDEGSDLYQHTRVPVFLNTTFTSLAACARAVPSGCVIGFCGLPTFLKREVLEVCVLNNNARQVLTTTCANLATRVEVVADQIGFVTPRIICMIINEAYITAAEGTASREDIDRAMKLGTNYPFGPFEWSQQIGLPNVVALLQALQRTTTDDRYQINDLLKAEALSNH
ncbi:MAG: 3-hydroxyacyl-CoA dehydrogenase [Cytophagales bacterium]|nr:3-hydroxyacyl-CoA dehydrogenase [Cytophagales bacterium]